MEPVMKTEVYGTHHQARAGGAMTADRDTPAVHTSNVAKPSVVRRGLLDFSASPYLRLFGAAGIVWAHTAADVPFRVIGGVGLAIFLYLSFLQAGQQRGFYAALKPRRKRLLVPLAGWWLIYALLSIWIARGIPRELTSPASIWVLLAWPAIHLWYLVFVFVGGISVRFIRKVVAPLNMHFKAAFALVFGLGLLASLAVTPNLPPVAAQFWYALPTIGLGLAYGYCLRLDGQLQRQAFIAIAALVAVACVPIWLWGESVVAVAYTSSALLMILCTVPMPRYRLLTRFSTMTLGIYIAHPLAMLIIRKVLGGDTPYVIVAVGTFFLAALITWSMRQTPILRRLV